MSDNNNRDISIPKNIIIHVGNEEITINYTDMPIVEYLKLCISMRMYAEIGVIWTCRSWST
jgi:hypothetical protein